MSKKHFLFFILQNMIYFLQHILEKMTFYSSNINWNTGPYTVGLIHFRALIIKYQGGEPRKAHPFYAHFFVNNYIYYIILYIIVSHICDLLLQISNYKIIIIMIIYKFYLNIKTISNTNFLIFNVCIIYRKIIIISHLWC